MILEKKEIFGEQKGAHGNEKQKMKYSRVKFQILLIKEGANSGAIDILLDQSKWLTIQIIGVLRQENKKAVERNSSKEFKTSPKVNNRICQIKCVH